MAQISESSTSLVRRVFWRGGDWSKRQVAAETGLSLAMCNVVINVLAESGELVGVKQENGRAGRNSTVYRVNELYRSVLCLRVELADGGRLLSGDVLSVLGTVLAHRERSVEAAGSEALAAFAGDCLAAVPGVAQISLGIPGNVLGDEILNCDVPELEGAEALRLLRATGLSVQAMNDAHAMALGFYRDAHPAGDAADEGSAADVVSIAFFPEGVMPGMATVAHGKVIRGANDFAGMLGFAPLDEGSAGVREIWTGARGRELAARSLAALVAVVNPGRVLCSGNLLDACALPAVRERMAAWIPAAYLPRLEYREDLGDLYLQGLLGRALAARLV